MNTYPIKCRDCDDELGSLETEAVVEAGYVRGSSLCDDCAADLAEDEE